jgi:alanine racemase
VHLKIDTGMRRVGASPSEAVRLAEEVRVAGLHLAGIFTHLAVADEPANPYTDAQLQRFDAVLAELAGSGHQPPLIHAANSAGALAHPSARRSLVRAGIAVYGIEPGPELTMAAADLRPAMSLRARVAYVKRVAAGDRISYGLHHTFDTPASVATVPIGYADGVPRRLGLTGREVLIGGRRCPIAGVVTMDQLTVDVGDAPVVVGDEVVLIGRQGPAEIRAEEWARRLGTIPYEVVCGISKRVPRRHHGGPGGAAADRH